MITREQALDESITEFHYGECTQKIGPKGSVVMRIQRVRRNGKCQTWKTRPEDFRLPIKYGLRDCGEITPSNASQFHVAADCPLSHYEAVQARTKAEQKRHVGTMLVNIGKALTPSMRRKLFALSIEDKLKVVSSPFPAAAAAVIIHGQTEKTV